MKPLEIGKLYCLRENPLPVWDDGFILDYLDTSVPFLVLWVRGETIKILFEDKTGCIELNPENSVMEFL
jgi:hypothetical protein